MFFPWARIGSESIAHEAKGRMGQLRGNESYLTTHIKTTGGTMVLLFFLSQNTVSSATTVCQLRVGMTVPLSRKRWPVILVRKPAPIFITIQNRETWRCQKNVMPENVAQNQPVATRSSARHWLQKELQSRSVKWTAARVTCAMEPEYHWPARFCSWHAPFQRFFVQKVQIVKFWVFNSSLD